jgi:hypothetical protein
MLVQVCHGDFHLYRTFNFLMQPDDSPVGPKPVANRYAIYILMFHGVTNQLIA